MSNFIRKDQIPLCACGCGKKVKKSQIYKGWNKYILGHSGKRENYFEQFKTPPLCKCDCGTPVKWCNTRRKWNIYCKGHHWRGVIRSKETKDKMSIASKKKRHSEKTKKKLSLLKIGKPSWNKGIPCSKETKHKISKSLIGKYPGPKNPNWQGGVAAEPYCDIWLDKDYKVSIKERDNNKCQNPDCWKIAKRLSLHHIDYNKKNCHPWNLITLCNSCNSRANKNRKISQKFYQNIMNEKYKYNHGSRRKPLIL